ncbi:MAG: hypothetical protein Hyperionvirus7_6 [Hyperionvirus sp.]|uniref:F-box domain-containing protein n=1 Tax=Hyperionvirus sp. TaxID=2487770 RepID=A0A3G5A861_9VIRU|nr:MAG: hypothetical protein Hyperionvirus7_6 [Hyperionvirus sp.]
MNSLPKDLIFYTAKFLNVVDVYNILEVSREYSKLKIKPSVVNQVCTKCVGYYSTPFNNFMCSLCFALGAPQWLKDERAKYHKPKYMSEETKKYKMVQDSVNMKRALFGVLAMSDEEFEVQVKKYIWHIEKFIDNSIFATMGNPDEEMILMSFLDEFKNEKPLTIDQLLKLYAAVRKSLIGYGILSLRYGKECMMDSWSLLCRLVVDPWKINSPGYMPSGSGPWSGYDSSDECTIWRVMGGQESILKSYTLDKIKNTTWTFQKMINLQ